MTSIVKDVGKTKNYVLQHTHDFFLQNKHHSVKFPFEQVVGIVHVMSCGANGLKKSVIPTEI